MRFEMFCLVLVAIFGIAFCSVTEANHKVKHRHRSRTSVTSSSGCPGGICPARASVKTRTSTNVPRASH